MYAIDPDLTEIPDTTWMYQEKRKKLERYNLVTYLKDT